MNYLTRKTNAAVINRKNSRNTFKIDDEDKKFKSKRLAFKKQITSGSDSDLSKKLNLKISSPWIKIERFKLVKILNSI